MTLGHDWIKKVAGSSLSDDGTAKESEIRRVINDNEIKAKRFFERLRNEEISKCVTYCGEHGKPYTVLHAPLCVLGSAALSDFQTWAHAQHLEIRVFGLDAERFKQKREDFVALLLAPNR